MTHLQTSEVAPVLIDGLWTDPDTGEVLEIDRKPDFQIVDDESAEWVLERFMNAELDKARIQAKRKALIENLDKQEADADRRIAGLHWRFGSDLEHYAATALEGQKTKTLKLAYGSLSFRSVKGGLRVNDKSAALVWAKGFCPEAIKTTEEFQISLLPDDKRAELVAKWRPALEGVVVQAFEVKPDETKFTVKTGLGKDGDS